MKQMSMVLAVMACVLTWSGCDMEASDNGELDGFWHLVSVDTLSNHQNVDYSENKIFWSVQGTLLQLSTPNDNPIIYRLNRQNYVLHLHSPLLFDRDKGDTPVADLILLRPYGVNALNEEFEIAYLKNRRMVLMSPVLRLTFRKY